MFNKTILALGVAVIAFAAPADAQDTIKIGVILPYSGQFADTGVQLDNGIKLYMRQHGDTVAGKKIEVIRNDVGGIAPDVAKRLAQELVVRDRSISWRASHSRRCAGCRRRVGRGEEVHGRDECRDLDHHDQSPYMARTSVTPPQSTSRSAPGRRRTA